jgi:acetylornithine deacetylase/succinyl-diaminopimelate desuccinylase-like protein
VKEETMPSASASETLHAVISHLRTQQQSLLDALHAILSIPSVSMDPAHTADMTTAAQWLADYLRRIGMDHTAIIADDGHPMVISEWLGAGNTAPTLLIYGHYDVQPADPADAWYTPPFVPTVRNNAMYARGASDDKGQVMAAIAALEAWLHVTGRLPVNVRLIIEGEEETSSVALRRFVRTQPERLQCDAVMIIDSTMLTPQQPLILYGTRGNCYLEVTVRGPAGDLHSGTFGGAVENPFNVLVRLLAALQDGATRRVRVPGFYDRVRAVDDTERRLLASLPLDDAALLRMTGVPALAGEAGFSTIERASIRPTLDIHGIGGGFTGPGKKTVIPAQATAKISMRLVPYQAPHEIARFVTRFLQEQAPPTVTARCEGAECIPSCPHRLSRRSDTGCIAGVRGSLRCAGSLHNRRGHIASCRRSAGGAAGAAGHNRFRLARRQYACAERKTEPRLLCARVRNDRPLPGAAGGVFWGATLCSLSATHTPAPRVP